MKASFLCCASAAATLLAVAAAAPAHAEDGKGWTIRLGAGAQLVPHFPGADDTRVVPYGVLGIRHTGDPIPFGAPGDSPGLTILSVGGFQMGPVVNLGPSRKVKDLPVPLHKVDTTFEAGAFAQFYLLPAVRVRAEVRHGIGGHDGLIGNVGADFIVRDHDTYILSIGPRWRFSDKHYQRAYFGITPADAVASGLPAYDPGGGSQAVGVNAGALYQFSYHWGVSGYARYDRLISDPGKSPLVRTFGSRDQFSTGLALTYTFDLGKI